MEFYLNGEKRNYEGDPNLNLMDYLRNTEKIISPKDGCSPEGVCGCCTVLLDNKAVKSCISAMKRVEGKEVVTTEGLSAEKRETVGKCLHGKRRTSMWILYPWNFDEGLAPF